MNLRQRLLLLALGAVLALLAIQVHDAVRSRGVDGMAWAGGVEGEPLASAAGHADRATTLRGTNGQEAVVVPRGPAILATKLDGGPLQGLAALAMAVACAAGIIGLRMCGLRPFAWIAAATGRRSRGDGAGWPFAPASGQRGSADQATVDARTALILDSTTDAIFELDRGWRFTQLNRHARRMVGKGRDLTGIPIWETFPGLAGSVFWTNCRRAMDERVPVEFEGFVADLDAWCEVGAYPTPAGIAVFLRDMTVRRSAESELAASRARYEAIVGTAVDSIIVIDDQGSVQSFNPAAERVFGYGADEVVGRNISMLMPDIHAVRHDDYLSTYKATGQRRVIGIGREVEGRRKDGTLFPAEVSVAEWMDGDRRCFTGILRDITARKEMERSLRESEERLRLALDAARADTWSWDVASGRVTSSDERCKRPGQRLGTVDTGFDAWIASIHPEDRGQVRQALHETLVAQKPEYRIEFRLIHPEEGTRWIAGMGRATYDAQGRPMRLAGINLDVTDRKAAETYLRTSRDAADAANQAKTKFLAAASHDLRQPVQSLELFASVLEPQFANHSAGSVLAHMQESIGSLKRLLDGLLDISKIGSGTIVPHVAAFPVDSLLRLIEAEYGPRAGQAGLSLRVVRTSAWTESDPQLLERILRNLVENALRYTPTGRILVGVRRHRGRLRIDVVDTGTGIAPERLNDIFDEFSQLDGRKNEGLGLGLAIVRGLCDLLGHKVQVTSEVGYGSRFSVELPAAKPRIRRRPVRTAGAQPVAPGPRKTGTVLLIDDEAIIRMSLEATLVSWGWRVVCAGSAGEAERLAAGLDATPDAIITDHRLGDGLGTDLIRRIRAIVGAPVPALLLTGDTNPSISTEAGNNGWSLLHKPVSPRILQAELMAVTARNGHAA